MNGIEGIPVLIMEQGQKTCQMGIDCITTANAAATYTHLLPNIFLGIAVMLVGGWVVKNISEKTIECPYW